MRPAEGPDVGGSPSGVARPRVAVVLAGRRGGPDALAEAAGAVHRALLEIEGQPMLVRVVERLLAWPSIEHVIVNIDAPELARAEPALARRVAAGEVTLLGSTASPSRSVLESLDAARLEHQPVLVTTADHALLDEHMLARFLEGAEAAAPDLAVALVSRRTIEARFPTARRTYLRFRDGAYSGANLFLFRTPAARRAALFWQRVEQERKRPWRIAKAFGWLDLILFVTRRLTLDQALVRASRRIGAQARAIPLDIAEAAVDVDKLEDLVLVRRILDERAVTARGA
ncbi:MAG: NTP transferase domain-containing protein [Spirochaetaceae bacterium]|nr:nucleotidyltransferase family protein [Myxococcales bacterium]MCB9725767.1 NTP transferase domain-containing protein [Spirochaetaceae bacterium]HPG25680.1 nucleotidyltransferase family protein [Myxococcota bacterium]